MPKPIRPIIKKIRNITAAGALAGTLALTAPGCAPSPKQKPTAKVAQVETNTRTKPSKESLYTLAKPKVPNVAFDFTQKFVTNPEKHYLELKKIVDPKLRKDCLLNISVHYTRFEEVEKGNFDKIYKLISEPEFRTEMVDRVVRRTVLGEGQQTISLNSLGVIADIKTGELRHIVFKKLISKRVPFNPEARSVLREFIQKYIPKPYQKEYDGLFKK